MERLVYVICMTLRMANIAAYVFIFVCVYET